VETLGLGFGVSIFDGIYQYASALTEEEAYGEDLPKIHGYPLRAIIPGIYGMKNVKWLSKIELVNLDFKGYWEKKGWSDEAIMPVKSQILMPMEGKKISLGNACPLAHSSNLRDPSKL